MMKGFPEKLASVVLACNGSKAIRQLRNTAAAAYRYGRLDAAATLRCMAEAAEREAAVEFLPVTGAPYR